MLLEQKIKKLIDTTQKDIDRNTELQERKDCSTQVYEELQTEIDLYATFIVNLQEIIGVE